MSVDGQLEMVTAALAELVTLHDGQRDEQHRDAQDRAWANARIALSCVQVAEHHADNPLPLLYVAGPMTGYPDWNHPAFNKAAATLRDTGYPVFNPADFGTDETDWVTCLRRALRQVLRADAIAVLHHWEGSIGAVLEVDVARRLHMQVKPVAEWIKDRDPSRADPGDNSHVNREANP